MARINFEDDIESRAEFWRLFEITKDRDLALGKLVRFFRIAQKYNGHGLPIPGSELSNHGLECMVESGWAKSFEDGYKALGADRQFAWYRERVENSSKGGKARASGERDSAGRFIKTPAEPQPNSSRNQPASSPLAPSPSLSLTLSNKDLSKKDDLARSEINSSEKRRDDRVAASQVSSVEIMQYPRAADPPPLRPDVITTEWIIDQLPMKKWEGIIKEYRSEAWVSAQLDKLALYLDNQIYDLPKSPPEWARMVLNWLRKGEEHERNRKQV